MSCACYGLVFDCLVQGRRKMIKIRGEGGGGGGGGGLNSLFGFNSLKHVFSNLEVTLLTVPLPYVDKLYSTDNVRNKFVGIKRAVYAKFFFLGGGGGG